LEDILSSTGIAIIAANEKNELMIASPAAVRLLNQKSDNGKSVSGPIPSIFLRLLKGWKAIGKTRVVWVEVDWPNGKTKLIRLAPMSVGDSMGWVMVIRDITYMKKLESFIFRDFAKIATQIQQPMEKAAMVIADLDTNLNGGEGDPKEQIAQLRALFKTVQEGSRDLLSLSSTSTQAEMTGEVVLFSEFLEKTKMQLEKELPSSQMLRLKWDISPELPKRLLDHSTLAQLIHHLLQYAELRSQETGELQFSAWAKDDSLWFVTTDSRPADADLDQNFSPFLLDGSQLQQLDQAQIEFAVVKSLVSELDGQVWLSQSEEGGLAIAICFKETS
jgi:signal transduction histidine kinase